MTNAFYYYGKNGDKFGPISVTDLKTLAAQGIIEPKTLIENQQGQSAFAEQVKGLIFQEVSPQPATESVSPPDSSILSSDSQSFAPEDMSVASDTKPLLSRAIFIFLAVFVGTFGVHDFYAKRVRQGIIHLVLLSAWILTITASIFNVFGSTVLVLSHSPHRKEIKEIRLELKDNKKKIDELKQKRDKIVRELEAARNGRKRLVPRQDSSKKLIVPQPDEPQKPKTEESGKLVIPTREEPKPVVPPQPPVEIDWEYVQELEDSLQELLNSLNELELRQIQAKEKLATLGTPNVRTAFLTWASGFLWLYFFFWVLPLASWVMAMFEIVYVTKDGTDREFSF